MELKGKSILVIGLGKSGLSAARFCAERGAAVTAFDHRSAEELPGAADLGPAVEIVLGGEMPDPAPFDLVIPSPGVPQLLYSDRARAVQGDIALAARFLEIPIIAVTGTNGKSTVVTLIAAMLRSAGLRARAAGNLGTAALSLVGEALDVAVLEVSSFQLEASEGFAPRVAVVLNVAPDHLDRHGDLASYAATKARLLAHQGPDDFAILNIDDPAVAAMAPHARAQVIPISCRRPLERGLCLDANAALWRNDEGTRRIALDALELPGAHNLENVLVALAAVMSLGVDAADAMRAVREFPGLPHRCEVLTTRRGVTYVNDSKATNPAAALRALESFPGPIHWIAGGKDKDLDFSPLRDVAAGRVKRAYLIGESAPQIARVLSGAVAAEEVRTLANAVSRASREALPGEVVLLAPACSSFDQFGSFEERGDAFRTAVAALPDGRGQ